ncbi:MAG: U32 family peptidase, partial [Lachnospiraceae bacterium]|nr:U32 family peptidase [Lachnospiraceae bacterium]
MKCDKKIELLSPAGSLDSVKAAINAGCDAVYMGGEKFGARAYAESVSEGSIIDAIRLCKEKGVKFYLTINTLFKQTELKELFLYIEPFIKEGVDGYIVQDIGIGKLLKEKYPDIKLHASTQMTITSSYGVKMVENMGYDQVVLSRELSIYEIKKIRKESKIKLECFIHGSMCYAYSGACLMSSFIGGQSGNRGRCKGPCRHGYNIDNDIDNKECFILSMKDMCALKDIKNYILMGIDSLKIEGRMRKPIYVAGVTHIYRKYIDAFYDAKSIEEYDKYCKENIDGDMEFLKEVYDKGGFTNYLYKHNGSDMIQMIDRKPRVPDGKILKYINDNFIDK